MEEPDLLLGTWMAVEVNEWKNWFSQRIESWKKERLSSVKTVYFYERLAWRGWLDENYRTESEIWLVTYRKATGMPSLPYNDAVEEALCFGWIDGKRKGLDEERLAQRFTPRRPGSAFSQTNKERIARLLDQGLVMPEVVEGLENIDPASFVIPDDIRAALQAVPDAWAFFQSTSPSYQRIRAAYVDHARKRPGEFEKRLRSLVEKSAQGKQFGYGIEAYY